MIDPKDWKWFGYPLHFICADDCHFHLGTLVGGYVISTVGDMRKEGQDAQPIGLDRLYETMVFRHNGQHDDCGCPQIDPTELDAGSYNDHDSADIGHYQMCLKWAKNQRAKEIK